MTLAGSRDDWFLDITSPDYRTPEQEKSSLQRIERLNAVWAERTAVQAVAGTAAVVTDVELALVGVSGLSSPSSEKEQRQEGGEGLVAVGGAEEETLPTFQSSWVRQFR